MTYPQQPALPPHLPPHPHPLHPPFLPPPPPTFVPARISGGEPARIKDAAAGGAVLVGGAFLTGAQAQMTKGDKGLMRTPKSPGARIAPTIAGSPSPFRGLANKKKNRMALKPL